MHIGSYQPLSTLVYLIMWWVWKLICIFSYDNYLELTPNDKGGPTLPSAETQL